MIGHGNTNNNLESHCMFIITTGKWLGLQSDTYTLIVTWKYPLRTVLRPYLLSRFSSTVFVNGVVEVSISCNPLDIRHITTSKTHKKKNREYMRFELRMNVRATPDLVHGIKNLPDVILRDVKLQPVWRWFLCLVLYLPSIGSLRKHSVSVSIH
jgi:hypothetical protein